MIITKEAILELATAAGLNADGAARLARDLGVFESQLARGRSVLKAGQGPKLAQWVWTDAVEVPGEPAIKARWRYTGN